MIQAVTPDERESYPVNVNVRIQLGLYEDLQGVSDRHGVKLSDVVRLALRRGLVNLDREIGQAIEDASRGS